MGHQWRESPIIDATGDIDGIHFSITSRSLHPFGEILHTHKSISPYWCSMWVRHLADMPDFQVVIDSKAHLLGRRQGEQCRAYRSHQLYVQLVFNVERMGCVTWVGASLGGRHVSHHFSTQTYKLLPDTQFGCRPKRTTEQALLVLANTVDQAWLKDKVVTLVAFDPKGPFNGVKKLTLDARDKRDAYLHY
jgi:hypothetical protein